MRTSARGLVQIFSEVFDPREPILEVGSSQVPEQGEFANLRPFFSGKRYVGIDMTGGVGVDFCMDIQNLTPESPLYGVAGTVISVDTLEHIANPFAAVSNMLKLLAPDGVMLLHTVMNYGIHKHPMDYWRFTEDALRLLCKGGAFFSGWAGEKTFPHTVFALAAHTPHSSNRALDKVDEFERRYEVWREKHRMQD